MAYSSSRMSLACDSHEGHQHTSCHRHKECMPGTCQVHESPVQGQACTADTLACYMLPAKQAADIKVFPDSAKLCSKNYKANKAQV